MKIKNYRHIIKLLNILFLISVTNGLGREKPTNSNLKSSDVNYRTTKLGEIASEDSIVAKTSSWSGYVMFRFKAGHHDDLTRAKSFVGPKLEGSSFYFSGSGELGVRIKLVYLSIFGSATLPLPTSTTVRGYKHSAGFTEGGVNTRIRLFPYRQKITLTPIGGYRWIDEGADIYDPSGVQPDILALSYIDRGYNFGFEFSYKLRESTEELQRLTFTYLHENLKKKSNNKFRAEWGGILLGEFDEKDKSKAFDYLQIFLGFEFLSWSDNRKDWFFVISISGE